MNPTVIMRHMRLDDIPQVVRIDETSFPTPWSARTYQFELNNNRETSNLVVLEMSNGGASQNNGFRKVLQRFWGPKPSEALLAGYGGCWLISGEAHISTIAVAPEFRGRGLGELLLAGMLLRAIHLGGEFSVLEVRVSNATAQALYRKYEYEVVGRRRGYYRDNNEDAYLMEARPLDDGYYRRLQQRLQVLRERVQYVDRFSALPPAE